MDLKACHFIVNTVLLCVLSGANRWRAESDAIKHFCIILSNPTHALLIAALISCVSATNNTSALCCTVMCIEMALLPNIMVLKEACAGA